MSGHLTEHGRDWKPASRSGVQGGAGWGEGRSTHNRLVSRVKCGSDTKYNRVLSLTRRKEIPVGVRSPRVEKCARTSRTVWRSSDQLGARDTSIRDMATSAHSPWCTLSEKNKAP